MASTRSPRGATVEHGRVAVGLCGREAARITYADGTTEVRFRTDGVNRCQGGRTADTSSMRRATAKQAATFTPYPA